MLTDDYQEDWDADGTADFSWSRVHTYDGAGNLLTSDVASDQDGDGTDEYFLTIRNGLSMLVIDMENLLIGLGFTI